MKKLLLLMFLIPGSLSLFALDNIEFKDPLLKNLLSSQKINSLAWASNEDFLSAGNIQYELSKSGLYPQIDVAVDGAGSNSFLNKIPAEPEDIELKNDYSVSISPSVSVSQLLPTSGIMTGSVTDTISGSGLEESNSPLQPPADIEFINSLSFSLGITQPLYFGNAYTAAKTQIFETKEIGRISYLDNKNNLIISAVSDYYSLLQAAYQKELIKARLETNSEYEKRILREHSLGMWTQGQLNSAKAARLQSEADLLKAVQAYSSAGEKIQILYGTEISIDTSNADIEILPFDESGFDPFISLSEGNPEALIGKKQIMIAESDIIIEKKNSAANLTLGSIYSRNNDITEEGASDNLSFSLGLSMPLIDGGSSRKSIELKQNQSEKLKKDFEEQQKITFSQLQLLLDNIEVSKKLSVIYELQTETALFDYERGNRELELGRITQKELLELQIALENNRLSILINKIDYNLTVLQIYRLLGFDLGLVTGTQEGAE